MNNPPKEFNNEQNSFKHDNYPDIILSDIPSEIVSDENNDDIYENENKVSEKKKSQHIVLLTKYVPKKKRFTFFDWETTCSKITIILLCIFPLSFIGLSVADIVIQLMNLKYLNPYLIDDILLILSIILAIGKSQYAPAVFYFTFCGYIADNVLFFIYFEQKIQSPQYVKDFYMYFPYLKFGSLGLPAILSMILFLIECIIENRRNKLIIN